MPKSVITASRYHDFSYGHRVVGHENKCAQLHGHNGRVHFTVRAEHLDIVGRVLDFSAIKSCLCEWIEDHWDHKFLMWTRDPWQIDAMNAGDDLTGIVRVPFNPTAENMADYLLHVVGPATLPAGIVLQKVVMEETRKCCASAELPAPPTP